MLGFLYRRDWRMIAAYIVAFAIYTVCTGWIIPVYEKFFCDLMTGQVFWLRVMSGMPRFVLAPWCGMLEKKIEGRIGDGLSDFLRKAVAGTFSLCAFQLLPYVASALFMKAGAHQMMITVIIYIAIDIGCGWWYASLLEGMSRRFRADVLKDW